MLTNPLPHLSYRVAAAGHMTVSLRELMIAAAHKAGPDIHELCNSRAIVMVGARLINVGEHRTHGVPSLISLAGADEWQYPIAEIALGKLKITAQTLMPSEDVPEEERLRISGFSYYGSVLAELVPLSMVGIAASGLSAKEDVRASGMLAEAAKEILDHHIEHVWGLLGNVTYEIVD